ncbi:MAG TPA: carboxymuconolactone decarboxylase family protein [Gemmatimonadales bacterium]|nr:carboxymuconolactone decarboxylase family protein [Gemmatimonadales bacterium]
MRARGAGRGSMAAGTGPVLDAPTAALVRVAAAVARGKAPELKARFSAARDARVPGLWIEELLLQSMLVVGYPLALVAFAAWRGVGGPAPVEGAEDLAHADWESWAARGAAVCREVYGRAYHKLLVNLRALHPALEDLVLVDAYGKVIGRPGLDLKRRELCTVATTAVLGTAEQLHSHLRGALNTGAEPKEIEAVLELVDGDLDPERRRSAREQWGDVKRRRL